ncbi:MAG: hypothetical protein K2P65_12230 [Lachnospiraceae bacterium]|nr:hypothetical protein [Lachnospiraceae bacterium]
MTVTYSVNGENVKFEDLKNLEITKKDYIDYIEAIKKTANDFHKEQKC